MSQPNADYGVNSNTNHSGGSPRASSLLALAPGLRETGWAVFDGPLVAASGIVGLKSRRKIGPPERIAHQLEALTAVAAQWRPARVVRSKPSGVPWRVPGLEQLDLALHGWAAGLGLPMTGYTAQEVRAAVAGQPNASKDALGYAIMLRLGLIGQSRATAEWEAIAVGHYNLIVKSGERPGPLFVDSPPVSS